MVKELLYKNTIQKIQTFGYNGESTIFFLKVVAIDIALSGNAQSGLFEEVQCHL